MQTHHHYTHDVSFIAACWMVPSWHTAVSITSIMLLQKLGARRCDKPLYSHHLTKKLVSRRGIKLGETHPPKMPKHIIAERTDTEYYLRWTEYQSSSCLPNDFSWRQVDKTQFTQKLIHLVAMSTSAESLKDQFPYSWHICLKFTLHNISLNVSTSYILWYYFPN